MAKKAPPDDIRDEILALFAASGMTQIEVARGARLSKNTVSDFLGGARGISTRKATAILRFLMKQPRGRMSAAGGGDQGKTPPATARGLPTRHTTASNGTTATTAFGERGARFTVPWIDEHHWGRPALSIHAPGPRRQPARRGRAGL
jgi:hypothetical protein